VLVVARLHRWLSGSKDGWGESEGYLDGERLLLEETSDAQ
jgi:hypothetical protein